MPEAPNGAIVIIRGCPFFFIGRYKNLQKLSDNFKWKYHGKIENTQTLRAPEDFNELSVYVVDKTNPQYTFAHYIQKEFMDTNQNVIIQNGYAAAGPASERPSPTVTRVYIQTDIISFRLYYNEGDYTTNGIAYVYYR